MDSNTILDKNNKGTLSAEGKALAMRIAKERPPNADSSANVYGLPTVEPDESSTNEDEERGTHRRKQHKSKKEVEREGLLGDAPKEPTRNASISSEDEDDEEEESKSVTAVNHQKTTSRKKRVGSKSYHSLGDGEEEEEGSVVIDGDESNGDLTKKKKRTTVGGGGSSKTSSSKGSAGRGRGRGSSSHAGSSSRASSSSHSPILNESRSVASSPKNENDAAVEQPQQVRRSAQKGSMPPRSGGSGSGTAGGDSSSDLVGIVDKRRSVSVFSQASQSIMNLLSNSSLINKNTDTTQASNAAATSAVAPTGPDIELQIETTSSVVFRIIFYGWYLLLILAIVLQVIVNIQWDCKNVCGQECGLLSLGDWRSGSCSDVKTTTVNEHTFDENHTAINVTRTVYDLTWEGSVGYVADDRLNRFVHVVVVMPRPNVTNSDDLRYDLRFALNVSNTADNEDGIKFGEVVAVATLHCDGGKARCQPVILNTNIAQAATNASSLSIVISDAPKPLADVANEAGVAYVFQHSQYTIGTLVVRYALAFFSLIHLIRFIYHKPVHGLYEQTWVIILHFALFLYLDPLFAGGVYLRPAPSIFSFIEFRVPIYFIATFVAFMFSVITSAHAWASDDSSLEGGGSAPSPTTTAELYDPPLRTKLIAVSYVAVIVVLDIIDGYLHNWDWSDEHCPNFNCTVPGFALYILLGLGVLVCTCWLWWLRGNLGQKPYFACRAQQLAFRIFVIVFISAVFYLVMQTILVFAIYHSISALVSFQILIQIGPILVMVAFVNIMTYVYTSTLRTGKGEKGDREKGVPIRPMDPTWKETVWEERWYRWLALHGGSMYMFVSEAEEQLFDFIQSQGALRKEEARRYEDSRDSQGGFGGGGGGSGGGGSGNVFKNMVSHFRSSMSPHSPRRDSRTRLPSYYDGEMVYTVPEWKLDKDLTPFERLVREYEIKLAMKRKADMERAEAERLALEEGFEVVSGEGGAAGDFEYDISEPPTPRENDYRRSSSSSASSSSASTTAGSRGRRAEDGYAEDDDANNVHVGVLRSTSNERNYDSTEDYRPPPRTSSSSAKGSQQQQRTSTNSAVSGNTSKKREGSSSTKKKGGGPLSPTYSSGGKKIRRGGAASPAFSSSASPRRGVGSGRTPTAHGKRNGRWSSGNGNGTDSNGNPFRTVANFGKGVMNTIVEAPNTLGEGIARIEDGFMAMGYALGGQTAVPRKPFFNLETCVDLFNLSWEVYGRPTPAADLYLITDAGSTSTGRKAPGVDEVTKPWYKRVFFCIKWGDEGEVEDEVDYIKKHSGNNNNGGMVENDITASLAQNADGRGDVASSPNGGGGPGDTAFLSITHGSARGLTNEMSISAGDPANKTMPLRPINNITRVPLAGGAEKHFSSEQKGASGLGVNNGSSHPNTSSSRNNSIERNKTVGSAQQQQQAAMATRSQSQSPTVAEAAAVDQTPPICSEQYGYELVAVHEALDVQTIICVMDTDVRVHRGKVPRIVVAFRGSTNLSNFEQDVRFTRVRWTEMPARSALSDKWVGPTVHQGFLNVWSALRHFVLTEVQELHRHLVEKAGPNGPTPQVYLTGHSLGGAIATLCAYAMKKTLRIEPIVYTFGAPIVGNKGFKDEYNREIRRTFRIVNESDMVVSLTQFGGHHVGIEAAIDRMGNFICEPMFIERWLRPTQGKGFAAQNHLMGAYGASLNAIIKQGRFGRCPLECQKSYFEPHERSTIMSIASRRRMHEMRLQEKESGAYDAVLHETIGAFKSSGVYSSSASYSSPVNTSGYYDYYNNNKHNANSKNNNNSNNPPYGSPTNSGGVYADPSNNRYSTSSTSALLPAGPPPNSNTRSQTYYSADHVGQSTAGGANRYTGYRY